MCLEDKMMSIIFLILMGRQPESLIYCQRSSLSSFQIQKNKHNLQIRNFLRTLMFFATCLTKSFSNNFCSYPEKHFLSCLGCEVLHSSSQKKICQSWGTVLLGSTQNLTNCFNFSRQKGKRKHIAKSRHEINTIIHCLVSHISFELKRKILKQAGIALGLQPRWSF